MQECFDLGAGSAPGGPFAEMISGPFTLDGRSVRLVDLVGAKGASGAGDRHFYRPLVRDLVEAARELETGCPDRGRELLVRALDDGWPSWREWW
jgi:hypothetical protein